MINMDLPVLRRFAGMLIAGVFLSGFSAGASAEWKIKQFRIDTVNPESSMPEMLQGEVELTQAQAGTILLYEAYLGVVATRYESMGFAEPNLPVVDGRMGGPAYRVYLFDYPDKDPIARAGWRSPDLPVSLRLDLSRAFRADGSAEPGAWDHLAHELFHNVQRAYQDRVDADRGFWIMEGQAQAMGMEMARILKRVDLYRGKKEDYRLGARTYYKPIDFRPNPDGIHEMDYRSSSFWHYLAEHYYATKHNSRAGIEEARADYAYLARLWQQPYVGKGGIQDDLEWLDRGMRKVFGVGFSRLYANFTSTHAGYMPERYVGSFSTTPEDARQNWLNFNFGPCPLGNVTATQPFYGVPLSIAENAARCLQVKLFGDGNADVSIQVRSETMAALKALRIGTLGGEKVGSPHRVEAPVGGGYIGLWEYTITAGDPRVFIVSNMSDDPTASLPFRGEVMVSTSFWESSITDASGPGAAKQVAPAKTQPKAAGKKDELKALSSRSSAGVSPNYGSERPTCAKPFGESACGPTMGITLELMPAGFPDTYKITGTGGALGQVMNQFSAIAANGLFTTDRAIKEAFETSAATEGSSVHIVIPEIRYGFTGTFDNAVIEVHRGAQGGRYQAIGPGDSQPGRGFSFWHSGQVVVEEFTPLMLRGSFSAQLVDTPSIDFDALGEDPTLPVHRRINGRFSIPAPWKGDRRVEIVQPQGEEGIEMALQDLAEAFPAVGTMDDNEFLKSASEPGSGEANYVGSPIGAFPECDCDASLKELDKACFPVCKPAVLSRGQENQRLERLAAKPAQSTAPAVGQPQTREEYIATLEAMDGLTQEQIDRLVSEMDAFWAERGGWPK